MARLNGVVLGNGRFVLLNDAVFISLTRRWEKLVIEWMTRRAEQFKDDIILGLINDRDLEGGWFSPRSSRWPVVSKEHFEALGYYVPEGKDARFLCRVYEKLGRIVPLSHIYLITPEPYCPAEVDDDEVDADVAKLADYIHSKHPDAPCSRRCPK